MKSRKSIHMYSGEVLLPVGEVLVDVQFNQKLPLIVLPADSPTLLGRNWMKALNMNFTDVNIIQSFKELPGLLRKFDEVFSKELGIIANTEAKILLKPGATPRSHIH